MPLAFRPEVTSHVQGNKLVETQTLIGSEQQETGTRNGQSLKNAKHSVNASGYYKSAVSLLLSLLDKEK